jgi:hypothetical protein
VGSGDGVPEATPGVLAALVAAAPHAHTNRVIVAKSDAIDRDEVNHPRRIRDGLPEILQCMETLPKPTVRACYLLPLHEISTCCRDWSLNPRPPRGERHRRVRLPKQQDDLLDLPDVIADASRELSGQSLGE